MLTAWPSWPRHFESMYPIGWNQNRAGLWSILLSHTHSALLEFAVLDTLFHGGCRTAHSEGQ
eukprot:4347692-Alexandrium_andersonii.AAC.1